MFDRPQTVNKPTAEVKTNPDQIGLSAAAEILGLSTMRARALATKGQIPSGKKDSKNIWVFSRKAVEEYAKNRTTTRSSDGKRTYKVRLSDSEVKKLAEMGIKVNLAYKAKVKAKAV